MKGRDRAHSHPIHFPENWKTPGWLAGESPNSDVILSTRVRVMRNLRAFPFPHKATESDLIKIAHHISDRLKLSRPDLEQLQFVTHRDRDALVSARLISPEFQWQEHGRLIFINENRTISIMVNEEDHLRLQVLLGGWQLDHSKHLMENLLLSFVETDFSRTQSHGWLSASPSNTGKGIRLSVMAHLIGLAHGGRIGQVLEAIHGQNLIARGAFGESSRAVGAFVQISDITDHPVRFSGACEYLLLQERQARESISSDVASGLIRNAQQFIRTRSAMTLSDSLRTLAYLRWGAHRKDGSVSLSIRKIDELIARMDLGEFDTKSAAEQRAKLLKTALAL